MFVDMVKLWARGGDGGAGSAHLHSEPYNPLGGPDGGDGGRGGDVIVRCDDSLRDLQSLSLIQSDAADEL
jgi:GTP-binding protein